MCQPVQPILSSFSASDVWLSYGKAQIKFQIYQYAKCLQLCYWPVRNFKICWAVNVVCSQRDYRSCVCVYGFLLALLTVIVWRARPWACSMCSGISEGNLIRSWIFDGDIAVAYHQSGSNYVYVPGRRLPSQLSPVIRHGLVICPVRPCPRAWSYQGPRGCQYEL